MQARNAADGVANAGRRRFVVTLLTIGGLGTISTVLHRLVGAGPPPPATGAPLAGSTTEAPSSIASSTTISRQTIAAETAPSTTATASPPEATTTTLPRPSLLLIEKAAWGAEPAQPGFEAHTPSRITIHHTATLLEENSRAPAAILQHQEYHRSLGWPDLAYHVMIDRAGNLYEGRPMEYRGDTATNYDPGGHFLPCLEGDYREEVPSEVQWEALAMLCAWAADRWGIDVSLIGGHKDFAETTCPGDNVYQKLEDGSLADRVSEILDGQTPRLEYLRGEEAVAVVEAVASGA